MPFPLVDQTLSFELNQSLVAGIFAAAEIQRGNVLGRHDATLEQPLKNREITVLKTEEIKI